MDERFVKHMDGCDDPECLYCALHCPYCGTTNLMLDHDAERMACPVCGQEDRLPCPEFFIRRRREILALSGLSLQEWKVKAKTLSPTLRYRWRSTVRYLAPAVSAAMSRHDDLVLSGWSDDDAMARVKTELPEIERLVAADPAGTSTLEDEGEVLLFLEDWF
jgi:ribosomal protein S27E